MRFVQIIVILLVNFVENSKDERRLLKKLFENYDLAERPVENDGDTVEVVVGMSLQQIVELDEKMQILRCSGWMDYGWQDHNLKWNPQEYGNITTVRVNAAKIWTPDVLLYNSADDSFDSSLKVNAVIDHTGNIKYLPPTMFKSTCEIAIHNFPFDEQKCELKFGSWTYDESKINLTALGKEAQTDAYKENGEWDLVTIISFRESVKYDCCAEKYPFVKFILHIRRRTLYFIFNLIFPCVLISMMTFLGFALPPDSGEKVALEITTLLSIIMFLQLITGIIPESSQAVPTIGVYFASVMLICTVSVVANVIILVFHHRNVKIYRMPRWIKRWINGYLACLLRMKITSDPLPNAPTIIETPVANRYSQFELNESSSKSLLANVRDDRTNEYVLNDDFGIIGNGRPYKMADVVQRAHRQAKQAQQMSSYQSLSSSSNSDLLSLKIELSSILKEIRLITRKMADDDEEAEMALEWKFAAMVLDKLCLYLFFILTVSSTVGLLFTNPNFFKLQ